jgi:hypothetical protein
MRGDDVPVLMLALINKGERADLSQTERNELRRTCDQRLRDATTSRGKKQLNVDKISDNSIMVLLFRLSGDGHDVTLEHVFRGASRPPHRRMNPTSSAANTLLFPVSADQGNQP